MQYCYFWNLVSLKKLIIILFSAIQIQAEDITFNCQNLNNFEDVNKLIIKYKDKHLLFKKNIYLFNSYKEKKIFAQRRNILLNSFLEFDEETYLLKEVNSWLYRITKDDYICRKSDSNNGYK